MDSTELGLARELRIIGGRRKSGKTGLVAWGPAMTIMASVTNIMGYSSGCLLMLRCGSNNLKSRHKMRLSIAELGQFSLSLLEPKTHSHLAIHGCRRGKIPAGVLRTVNAAVELAQTEVAMGDERTHAVPLGDCQRVLVVG
jgi:hypothetical protein